MCPRRIARVAGVYNELAEVMADEGIAVFRYDRRGEGASTGKGDMATPDVLAADLAGSEVQDTCRRSQQIRHR